MTDYRRNLQPGAHPSVLEAWALFDAYFSPIGQRLAPVSDALAYRVWYCFSPIFERYKRPSHLRRKFLANFHPDHRNANFTAREQHIVFTAFYPKLQEITQ